MQTAIDEKIGATPEGREAEAILRNCVHCGFCNATCPTYQLLGDELDGPRGRIYLIKQVLEGQPVSRETQVHLDRCLTCLACETTCPSGVKYSHLLDVGRQLVAERVVRPWLERVKRGVLRAVLPQPRRFASLLKLGRTLRPLLPAALREQILPAQPSPHWPAARHNRKMLVLDGCVQPGLAPHINAATARVLDHLGISLIAAKGAGCCGAVSHHLGAAHAAQDDMRRNIDAWWPHVEAGAEAIVLTASGCGTTVKEYAHHLRFDPAYAAKAARITELARDIGEVLAAEDLSRLRIAQPTRVAFHAPCSLQHGQQLGGVVEGILTASGYSLTAVADAHLCCGSAGTYSLLQPVLSQQLLGNKVQALQAGEPELIATANIGCLTHLASRATVPAVHWIELLERLIPS